MSLAARIESVRNYLASHYMFVDNEWLSGCVEYLSEDPSSNYSEEEIQNLAKEQWLLNDLKDICPGSLPANLKHVHKTVLNGRFVLQVNAAVDIGTPAYQQYLKLQKANLENIEATTRFEDKVPSHRMMKLYLTDGVQDVSAIEYKPMRNLSCDITPGCKILIKGPVQCRRGVLLLREDAAQLLGGEVQERARAGPADVLAERLALPALPAPAESNHNTTINHPRNVDIPTPHTQMPPARVQLEPEPAPEPTGRPVARVTGVPVAPSSDDDIDIDQLAAIEAQLTQNTGKRPSNDEHLVPEKRLKVDTASVNRTAEYPDDNDLFCEEDEEYLKEIEQKFDAAETAEFRKTPIAVSSEPYVYIKQINDTNDGDKAGNVYRVKGQIMKLLSKLSVGRDGWSLRCTIVDGTGSLDVDFASDVLSELVGYTPREMNQLKKEMATKPELKEKAVSALQRARDSLQVLYCIIELTMLQVPNITRLIPFQQSHVDLLAKRVHDAGIKH